MQECGACARHLGRILTLQVEFVALNDILVDREGTSIDRVLDRPHLLLGLGHALEVEIGAVLAQQTQTVEVSGANGKEDTTDAVIVALLVDADQFFPEAGLVSLSDLALDFLLLVRC